MKKANTLLSGLVMFFIVFFLFAVVFLFLFGKTPPDSAIPDRCMLSAPLTCEGEFGISNNILFFDAKNSYSANIIINSITVRNKENTYIDCIDFEEKTIYTGSSNKISCNIPQGVISTDFGNKEKILFQVIYRGESADPKYSKTISGELISTVK